MTQNPELSIVVPVYQSGQTLGRCMESILSQSFRDFELIIVNDGSRDNSAGIALEFARTDQRVIVINRENGGLSAARNTGISYARAPWITFIDSDDSIEQETLKQNMEWLQAHPGTDLLEYPALLHHNGPAEKTLAFADQTVTADQMIADWVRRQGYRHCYAWNKIYRTSLFDTVRFPEGENFEDAATMPSIIRQCRTVRYSSKGLYLYTDTLNGITHRYTFHNQEPLFRHNMELFTLAFTELSPVDAAVLKRVAQNLLTDLCGCSDTIPDYIHGSAQKLDSMPVSLAAIFKADMSPREKVKSIIYNMLGTERACRLFSRKLS